MLSFNTVLFPVDFSDRSRGAARYVQAIGRRFQSRIILLHVVETLVGQPGDLDFGALEAPSLAWENRSERVRKMLDTFLADELKPLQVERKMESGDPARVITDVARVEQAGLVVMPTHGYGIFRRFILGSVTAKVLHDTDCPVWTGAHLQEAPPAEQMQIRRILCALDLAPAADKVLEAGAQLAKEFEAELVLIHAVPGTEAIPDSLLDCELRRHLIAEAREQLIAKSANAGVNATVIVDSGDVARVVRDVAKNTSADLVVIGRGHHAGFGRLRTHSYAIIRESPCAVLSI